MLTNNSYFFNHHLPFLGGLVSSGHEPGMTPTCPRGISQGYPKKHLRDIFSDVPEVTPCPRGISQGYHIKTSLWEKYSCFIFGYPHDIPGWDVSKSQVCRLGERGTDKFCSLP